MTIISIILILLIIIFYIYYKNIPNINELVENTAQSIVFGNINSNIKTGIGLVTRIIDGDTIIIDNKITIRLSNINAYEKNHPLAPTIYQYMIENVLNKTVTLHYQGIDKYDRTLATIILPNGINLNMDLIRRGYAVVYDEYCDKNSDYYKKLKQIEVVNISNKNSALRHSFFMGMLMGSWWGK